MYWVLLCLTSGTDLQKSWIVLKSLFLCNKVLSSVCLSVCLPVVSVCGIYENFSLMFSCCTLCVCVCHCVPFFCGLFLQCFFESFFLTAFICFLLSFFVLSEPFFFSSLISSLFLLKLKCNPFVYVLLFHARQTHHLHCLYFSERTVSVHNVKPI